jgi:hypothetical protein
MRAKVIGQGDSSGVSTPVSVDLRSLGRSFFGVGVNLALSNVVSREALIQASFTLIVTEEESL